MRSVLAALTLAAAVLGVVALVTVAHTWRKCRPSWGASSAAVRLIHTGDGHVRAVTIRAPHHTDGC